jgi:hypothetical protein
MRDKKFKVAGEIFTRLLVLCVAKSFLGGGVAGLHDIAHRSLIKCNGYCIRLV